jgi:hypothetical protein
MAKKQIKEIKVKTSDVGRFCRVFFEDVGATDGILTKVDGKDSFRFLPLARQQHGDITNNGAKCIALGKRVTAVGSGL